MAGKSAAQVELEEAEAEFAPQVNGAAEIPYRTAFALRCKDFALLGLTEAEMADLLGVSHPTFSRWKVEQPTLRLALQKGGKDATAKVAASLYRRAVGMKVKKEKAFNVDGQLQTIVIKEELPPDVQAGQFWLANKERGLWRAANAGDGPPALDLDAMVEQLEQRRQKRLGARPGDDAKPINTLDVVPERR